MKKLPLTPRFTISLFFGLLVVGFLLDTSWSRVSSPRMQYQRGQTQLALQIVRDEIDTYRSRMGRLPKTLNEIVKPPRTGSEANNRSDIFDGWGHPLIYEKTGDSFRVVSLGRDGRIGGAGLDYDVTTDIPFHINTWVPLAGRLPINDFIFSYPLYFSVPCFAGLFINFVGWTLLNPKFFKTGHDAWYWLVASTCMTFFSLVTSFVGWIFLTATH